jgi:hypothetical protein
MMTPGQLRRAMERHWRTKPCADPNRPACWTDRNGVLRQLILIDDLDSLVTDHDERPPRLPRKPF